MGYVYLICDPANTTFKIGVTRSLKSSRMKKLQTGNSTELHMCSYYETEYPFRMETMLHAKFRPKNVLNEWFDLDAYSVVHFKEICAEMESIIETMKSNPFFVKGLK